ncbi:hypothetical protein [Cytobacillus kochii]|uniref:hypothetical protein n=1 Tax=Cytobacillus kochii TaxID=859143 RepID=UPI0025A235DF|nr:hypothetical protein [Cytobacillus kochii]MDM5205338.1 hypothetical protein [Cytobacillus kochii]
MFNRAKKFSQSLGYPNWDELMNNSFSIFLIPPDANWFATQLPDKSWAIWNDEGHPPFQHKKFNTWNEAIRSLRDIFNNTDYPEENWDPEGFDDRDNVFLHEPDKSKLI